MSELAIARAYLEAERFSSDKGVLTKRVKDSIGTTLYFLEAYVYHYTDVSQENAVMVDFEATMDLPRGKWILVRLTNCPNIEEAILFFSQAYDRLGCVPNLNNQ